MYTFIQVNHSYNINFVLYIKTKLTFIEFFKLNEFISTFLDLLDVTKEERRVFFNSSTTCDLLYWTQLACTSLWGEESILQQLNYMWSTLLDPVSVYLPVRRGEHSTSSYRKHYICLLHQAKIYQRGKEGVLLVYSNVTSIGNSDERRA